jgi:hypothetical protein
MNDHGPLRILSKIPFIRYSPEKYGYTMEDRGNVANPMKAGKQK